MMRLLNKFASKFFGKKNEKGKSSDLSSQIISATVKRFKYKIIAGVALFFIIVVAILGVVSYLLGLVQENVERIDNLLRGGCILCTTEELEQKKEEQFQTKISIIGDEFGSKVDEVVLASTVLFQGDYYEVLDAEFDEDFDSEEYRNNVKDLLDSLSTTGGEGYDGIEQEEIDLIDSATIIMVNSNVDGKYNEDSYKEALASPGFGGDDWLINGSSCVAKAATDGLDIVIDGASIIGSFVLGNPLPLLTRLVGGAATGDGNAADHINKFANTVSICQYGFIGGTYDDVLNMPDGAEKEAKKKQIADEIISFAEFYKSLFPELTTSTRGSVCYYKIPGIEEEVSNLKVQTIQCESGNVSGSVGDDIPGEGLIDFETTYIAGVVYPEVGGYDLRTKEAQAVAARSFALTRGASMNGAYGIGVAVEDGQWVLRIRTCTSDQVFCHPDLGCGSLTGSMQGTSSGGDTVYAGGVNGNLTRNPISRDDEVWTAVNATKGEVAVNSNGEVAHTDFASGDQDAWAAADSSWDYKQVIINHYTSSGVTDVRSDCRGGGNLGAYDLEEYYQKTQDASVDYRNISAVLQGTEYPTIDAFNQHIKENINAAGYGTREGVAVAGISLVGDYIMTTGKKLRYSQPARQNPETEGIVNDDFYMDCSSFAWWSLYNGGFKLPCGAQTGAIYNWASEAGYIGSISEGQPGDFLVTTGSGHIMLILGTYDGGYYTAEFLSESQGAEITKHSYGGLSGYNLINMERYYSDSNNLR